MISVFKASDLVELKEPTDGPFDKAHYYAHPQMYHCKFQRQLPYVSFLVNGIYWEPKYPRVLSIKDLKEAQKSGNCRLLGACDISADYEGSIEFTKRFTSIDEPFLLWDG